MKYKILTVLLLALLVIGWTFQTRAQWEYKMVLTPTEKKLNELGAEGWELSAVKGDNFPTYVFKRQK